MDNTCSGLEGTYSPDIERLLMNILLKMVKEVLDNPEQYSKEVPPDGLLLWRLVGYSNVILANGDQWKRHSQVVKSALSGRVPIEEFASLSTKLFKRMGDGGRFSIDQLLMVSDLNSRNGFAQDLIMYAAVHFRRCRYYCSRTRF